MRYVGHVKDGVVVFDESAPLAEGTPVHVQPIEPSAQPTLADRWKQVIGVAVGLPADLALYHDHYLHGRPKK